MKETVAKEYHAFLVRLWREDPNRPWRVTLSDAHTQQVRHFATVQALVAHLEQLTDEQPPSSPSHTLPPS